MILIPSILTNNFDEFKSLAGLALDSKKFERIQADFIGEPFGEQTVSIKSTYPSDFKPMLFDAHLMTGKQNIGADVREAKIAGYDRIIGQIESIDNQMEFLNRVLKNEEGRYKVGIGIDLDTDVSCIDASMHRALDVILVMSVKAGRGGQKFEILVMEKIKKLNEIRIANNYPFKICVDGGVEKEMLPELENIGADEVVVGVKRLLQW